MIRRRHRSRLARPSSEPAAGLTAYEWGALLKPPRRSPAGVIFLTEGVAWFRWWSRWLTGDEKKYRAFRLIEQRGGDPTEKELVARSGAYAHYQKIVIADCELAQNVHFRRCTGAHPSFHLDVVSIAKSDNLTDDSVGICPRCECSADVTLPSAPWCFTPGDIQRGQRSLRRSRQYDRQLGASPRGGGPGNRHKNVKPGSCRFSPVTAARDGDRERPTEPVGAAHDLFMESVTF